MSDHLTHDGERRDVRTILGTGLALGVITAIGVAIFALISRALAGRVEVIVQSLFVLGGGAVATYVPSRAVRPHSVEAVGWSAFIGVIGAWTFTALDIVVLRPLGIYSWRWDAIGGGSGWWYIPIWWMGAALLAGLGGMVFASRFRGRADANPVSLATQAIAIAIVLFALTAVTRVTPFSAAAAALAFAVAVVIQVPMTAVLSRR